MTSKPRIGMFAAALALPLLFAGFAFVNGSGQADAGRETKRYTPVWHYTHTSVDKAVDLGSVAVRATVTRVAAAPTSSRRPRASPVESTGSPPRR